MVVNALGIAAVFALTLRAPPTDLPFWAVLALPALAATLFGLASLLTRKLERVRRSFVMDVVCVLLCCALPTGLGLAVWPPGERLGSLLSGSGGQLTALLELGVLGLAGMFWQERKLRRTLALVAA